MLNNVSVMGRMTANAVIRRTDSGKSVTSFCIAVDRQNRDSGADFIDCVAWSGTAEFIEKWFPKGKMIAISGRLSTRTWEDKEGHKRKTTEIIVNTADFCGDKQNNNSGSSEPEYVPSEFAVLEDDGQIPF